MTADTNADLGYRVLGEADDLDTFQVVPFYIEGLKKRVSVARLDGTVYAFDDLCPEHGCALSAGLLTGTTLMCQMGGCRWNVTTGELLRGPATTPLRTYPVRVTGGQVEAQVA